MEINGKYTFSNALIIFLTTMFLAFTFSQVVQVVFMLPYINLKEFAESGGQLDIFNTVPKTVFLISMGVSSFVMFIGGPLLYLKFANTTIKPALNFKKTNIIDFLMVGLLVLAFMPANSFVYELNSKIPFPQYFLDLEKQLEETTKFLTQFDNTLQFGIGFLVIAVLAGVGEELTFRGMLQNFLMKSFKHPHISIWVAAFVFSFIHMQFLGFFPRMLLGAMFGYLFYWSGNLVLAMYAHFVNNGFTVIMLHLYNQKIVNINIENQESMPLQSVLVSVAVCALILWGLYRKYVDFSLEKKKKYKF